MSDELPLWELIQKARRLTTAYRERFLDGPRNFRAFDAENAGERWSRLQLQTLVDELEKELAT